MKKDRLSVAGNSSERDISLVFDGITPITFVLSRLERNIVDYSMISEVLDLSESSIRDHVQNIIKKGIPVDKIKQNNKKIFLSIHMDLKKIASLETILELRDL